MEPGWPAAVEGNPAFELIHHLNDAVLDQVIHVPAKKSVGFEGVLKGRVELKIAFFEEVAAAERVSTARMPASVRAALWAPTSTR
jgi:hypothetical protein